jgi:SanA protein
LKKFANCITKLLLRFFLTAIILIPLTWFLIQFKFAKQITTAGDAPAKKVAVVFGAGLQRDGTPTAILKDRVETAVKLYKTNKVKIILLSGDNRFVEYNEPGSMREYALSLGVPDSAIVLDYAGRRTYDTCYRAKHIFGVEDAILVTQRFHLPRALFLCSQLGMSVTGTSADIRSYSKRSAIIWTVREIMATSTAIWDVYVRKPLPVLGEKEPIS